MGRRPLPILLIALAAMAGLAGCGEKSEPAPGSLPPATADRTVTESPPDAADFGTRADQLCATAMAEQEAIRRDEGGRQVTLGDRARLLVDLAPVREQLARDLAALPPPDQGRVAAQGLVLIAERRAAASIEAGRLYEAGGARAKIAAAAAKEHDERERFVATAEGLGLGACAEQLSRPEAASLRDAVKRGLGTGPPARRCSAFGERLRAELYGGSDVGKAERACVAAGANATAHGTVAVRDVYGIDRVFGGARATVTPRGGGKPVDYRVRITYEDGDYRIDKLD